MNVMATLLFYALLFAAVMIVTGLAQKRDDKRVLWFPILMLAIVAGLRAEGVGVDTHATSWILERCSEFDFQLVSKEYLFYVIGGLIYRITGSFNITFFAFAVLIYALVFLRLWDFREMVDLKFAALFFCLLFWGGTMNVLRQYVAVAMIFYATRYLAQQKRMMFLIWLILAAGFHITSLAALLFFVLYAELPKKLTVKQIIGICVVCAVVSVAGILFCFRFYRSYITEAEGIGLIRVLRLVVLFLPIAAAKMSGRAIMPQNEQKTKDTGVSWLLIVTGIGSVMGFGSALMSGIGRVAYYFRIFELVYFAAYLKPGCLRREVRWGLLAVLIVYGAYQVYTYGGIVPYSIEIW